MRLTIITGAISTGKSFVAEALHKADNTTAIYEVADTSEVVSAMMQAKRNSLNPIFVCDHTFTFTPHDLWAALAIEIMPAYMIHLSREWATAN